MNKFLKRFLKPKKLTPPIIFSFVLFLVFASMDFIATYVGTQNDISLEGNNIYVMWRTITGPYHYLDIPIWIVSAFIGVYFLNIISEFLAIWWINGLAFGHLLGWMSWSEYSGSLDFIYRVSANDWMVTWMLSGLGIVIGFVFTLIQILIYRHIIKH